MEIMIYDTHKIYATNILNLYEEYKEWIDTRNQKDSSKITIVSVNNLQSSLGYYLIITYYYQ